MRNQQSIGENRSKHSREIHPDLPGENVGETHFPQSANTIVSAAPPFVKDKLLANNVKTA
jgi:hypothetical protein